MRLDSGPRNDAPGSASSRDEAAMEAAGAMDAQNAPTAPWKTTERFSTSFHSHHSLFSEEGTFLFR
jgi:hypothetical protein